MSFVYSSEMATTQARIQFTGISGQSLGAAVHFAPSNFVPCRQEGIVESLTDGERQTQSTSTARLVSGCAFSRGDTHRYKPVTQSRTDDGSRPRVISHRNTLADSGANAHKAAASKFYITATELPSPRRAICRAQSRLTTAWSWTSACTSSPLLIVTP